MSAKRESFRSPRRLAALMRRRIPYALSSTRHPLLAATADPGDGLLCPDCLEPVKLARTGRELHFVHARNVECRLEGPGWMRHSATYAAYVQVRLGLEGAIPRPRLLRTCGLCRAEGWQSLPADLTTVDLTCHRRRDEVEDLLLFRGPKAACSVVVAEHLPDEPEALAGRAKSPVLVVLRADDLLPEPASWRPSWAAGLREWTCRRCRARGRRSPATR